MINLIKQLRDKYKLTQEELAVRLSISREYINKMENDKMVISLKTMAKISEVFPNFNVKNVSLGIHTVKQIPYDDFMVVPYLPAYAQAGYLNGYSDTAHDESLDTMLVPKEFERGNYLVIEVVGNSMDDGSRKAICEGDKLLIKELDKSYYTTDRLHFKEVLYVLATKEDGIIVKEIIKHDIDKGIVTCHSWNPMYKDFHVNVKEVIRLFYVKKIVERKIRF